jgi:hypothetical protein
MSEIDPASATVEELAAHMGSTDSALEPPATLEDALLAFQAEAGELDLVKDRTGQVGSQKTKYLSLDKLTDATRPLLVRHGLLWQTFPTTLDGKPALRYRLCHMPSGEKQEDTVLLLLDRETSQQQGAALTYARRQVRQAVLDVVAEDDTDAASGGARRPTGDARPMPKAKRENMVAAIKAKGKDLAIVLGAVGLERVEDATVGHGRKVAELLEDEADA